MFDIFTSRNVKKNLLISTLTSDQNVRPNSWTWRVLTQICRTFWEEYVGPESMIVDTLGVYCMLIFRHIFLSNYWWQKSDIWSQASYRYPISWEAFFDQSDSYFLFAKERGYHRWALAHSSSCLFYMLYYKSITMVTIILYIDNILTLSANMTFICTSFRNRMKRKHLVRFSFLFLRRVSRHFLTMYVYYVFSATSCLFQKMLRLHTKRHKHLAF